MRVEYRDMKDFSGEILLLPESYDDLWHLSHLIRQGDLVFATTFRTVETPQDKLRPEKGEKRPVRLGIRVERVSFHEYSGRLRIHGTIESGAEAGAHHTLNIEAGTELAVIKVWSRQDLERIERAMRASNVSCVIIISIEDGEAQLYRVRQSGTECMETITEGSGKGTGIDGKRTLFSKVLDSLSSHQGHLIVAGPGFVREDFARYLGEHAPELRKRSLFVETRGGGGSAVREAIGSGAVERLTGDLQLALEVNLMNELMEKLAKGGAVAYGEDEVREAIVLGAASQVLVIDSMLRRASVVRMLEEAEHKRTSITILSSLFEPGKQLESLGGIAALLRYRIK
ncbi:MAG: mRNA surveillance protein pelota [Methanomicrobiales archaeon]|nr:mRNA surveillance protein pelota [Methanomicrobiales archaeon]